MDILKDDIGKVFRHYLGATLGGAVIMTIYAFIDAVAVGQSEGPDGSAVMAIIAPIFGLFVFLALVFGIGGSVLMSTERGKGDSDEGNRWFTSAVIFMGSVTLIVWMILFIFHKQIMFLLGAREEMMPLLMRYAWWLIGFAPMIIFAVFLACFVRNDGNPRLAMRAVLVGGGFNILGDWLLVFPLHLGITGAAIATIASNTIQTVILCSHFFSKKNGMKLTHPQIFLPRLKAITSIGFGAGMLDLANVILFALMNNQIMRFGGILYLSAFGAISNMSTLFQSLYAGVGQALQPIASTNFGAKEHRRVRAVLKLALAASTILGILFSLFGILCPDLIIRILMDATPEVLAIAGSTIRPFSAVFLFMSINVTATYYLQSTLQHKRSNAIALSRGIFLSGLLILVFPVIWGIRALWFAMPVAECIVCIVSLFWILKR